MTASFLKAKEKGVSPTGLCGVVLYAHRTPGNSSSHEPFDASSLVLIIYTIVLLVTSTWPLAWGCTGEDKWLLMPSWEQDFQKCWLSNYFPLSMIITHGMPNWHITNFQTKSHIFPLVMVVNASASTKWNSRQLLQGTSFAYLLSGGGHYV